VEREVARRLELSGADARQWPRAAREEAARLDKRLAAASGLAAALRSEVAAEQAARQAEAVARAQLQARHRAGPRGPCSACCLAGGARCARAGAAQGGRAAPLIVLKCPLEAYSVHRQACAARRATGGRRQHRAAAVHAACAAPHGSLQADRSASYCVHATRGCC